MSLSTLMRRFALIIALGFAQSSTAVSLKAETKALTVDGSAFVLRLPDGRVLRGTELAGATVYLALDGDQLAALRLAAITPDPEHPDILRHDFEVPDGRGGWQPACEPNAYGERWGFPVSLPEDHPGRDHAITLSCASGAVVKCARFGYKPWARGPHGEDLVPLHAACVRMVRADYCGDGHAHTRNGTMIDVYDDLAVQVRGLGDDPSFSFEAGWSPDGAVCLRHTRWTDLLSRERLLAQCPRLARIAFCDEPVARALGARLFNTSRLSPSPLPTP
ncbi:ADYC domain-containing protein [Solimonas flava]|uniref:ADYC domain-containing protein n=1 Tax=Solimonas flava TaxID=415849 RepID=UPI000404326A|nr:ADYC domain-containing protein [Solimonas flava]